MIEYGKFVVRFQRLKYKTSFHCVSINNIHKAINAETHTKICKQKVSALSHIQQKRTVK